MQLGLFARLAIILSLVLSIAMLSLGTVLLVDAQQRFNATQLEHASSQAKTLAEASLDALVTIDYELLERWVVSVIPEKYYAFAYLAKSNGQVLTHSDQNMIAKHLDAMGTLEDFKIRENMYKGRPVKEVFYPARIGDTHLANAVVAYYLDEETFFEKNIAIKIALLIILSLLALLGVTLFIIRKFTAPISDLTDYVSSTSITDKKFHIDDKLLSSWGEVGVLSRAFEAMIKRLRSAYEELSHEEERLKVKVEERTHELEITNKELETFSYSVSHDLRAPLYAVINLIEIMQEDYANTLDESGQENFELIKGSMIQMETLIKDMLDLSRITRKELLYEDVELSLLASEILERYRHTNPERKVEIKIEDKLECRGDRGLLIIVMENLLGNAWKYSAKEDKAQIEFGSLKKDGVVIYYVKDNGAGFNMEYENKLFEAFQRLHVETEFQGSGVGLATVARVINRHKGKIWAESEPGKGSTFYFCLDCLSTNLADSHESV